VRSNPKWVGALNCALVKQEKEMIEAVLAANPAHQALLSKQACLRALLILELTVRRLTYTGSKRHASAAAARHASGRVNEPSTTR
jgi:hypothetical protein